MSISKYMHMIVYIYIYVCVCVCVCASGHVSYTMFCQGPGPSCWKAPCTTCFTRPVRPMASWSPCRVPGHIWATWPTTWRLGRNGWGGVPLRYLVGGLEHLFYVFHMLGIILPTDFHIFQQPEHTITLFAAKKMPQSQHARYL